MLKTTSFWRGIALPALMVSACMASFPARAASTSAAKEPRLEIQTPKKTVRFTRAELLRMAETLTLPRDPAYKKEMTYRAVPFHKLLKGLELPREATIAFHCLDGFSAVLTTERLLDASADASVPYVAIEEKSKPWPSLNPEQGKPSAGPFYLVWKNPEASKINGEEWPFQLASFTIQPSLHSLYPAMFPDESLPKDHAVRRGMNVFAKVCFACHRLNGEGSSQLGPDLNVPFSPSEYLRDGFLAKIVRDPQSLRRWPQAKMTPLDEKTVSDRDIADLEAYFAHMAGRKKKL